MSTWKIILPVAGLIILGAGCTFGPNAGVKSDVDVDAEIKAIDSSMQDYNPQEYPSNGLEDTNY